ncbi:hypothetical protein ACS0TY_019828 [Phlomoides rotata]
MLNPSRFLRGSRATFALKKVSNYSTLKPTTPPASTKKPTKAAAPTPAPAKSPKPKKTVQNTGIMKLVPVSPALQGFVGVPEVSRVEAVKKVWAHIKENNLQNPSDKREIFCDAKLQKLFGKEKVGFLEIAKLLSPHFVKTS